jgi:hypothetical protein
MVYIGEICTLSEAGKRQAAVVLLSLGKGRVVEGWGGEVVFGFSSILCNPAHPAFTGFPTEIHSNFQQYNP